MHPIDIQSCLAAGEIVDAALLFTEKPSARREFLALDTCPTLLFDLISAIHGEDNDSLLAGRIVDEFGDAKTASTLFQRPTGLRDLIHRLTSASSPITRLFGLRLLDNLLTTGEPAMSSWISLDDVSTIITIASNSTASKLVVAAHRVAGKLLSDGHDSAVRERMSLLVDAALEDDMALIPLSDIVLAAPALGTAGMKICSKIASAAITMSDDILIGAVLVQAASTLIVQGSMPLESIQAVVEHTLKAVEAGDATVLGLMCAGLADQGWASSTSDLMSTIGRLLTIIADKTGPLSTPGPNAPIHEAQIVRAVCSLLPFHPAPTLPSTLNTLAESATNGGKRAVLLESLAAAITAGPSTLALAVYCSLPHLPSTPPTPDLTLLQLVTSEFPGMDRGAVYRLLAALAVNPIIILDNAALAAHLLSRASEPDTECTMLKHDAVKAVDAAVRRTGLRHDLAPDFAAYVRVGPYAPAGEATVQPDVATETL